MRLLPATAALLLALLPTLAQAREVISIVGSSTVFPFSTLVAERFGRTGDFKTPKVESTGSGGGIKLFCKGLGTATPDIANASRRMKAGEFKRCQENGVTQIIEVLVGYDGVVLANSKAAPPMRLSLQELFMALGRQVPDARGRLINNPHQRWQDIHPRLPQSAIQVLGPPPTSGTRDAFVEIALGKGARAFPVLAQLAQADEAQEVAAAAHALGLAGSTAKGKSKGKELFAQIAHAVREDGAFVEAGENDNLIVGRLVSEPHVFGIFGYSFLEQNADAVQGVHINGVAPDFDSIADGRYAISRPLYFYVKKAHIGSVPGIAEYMREFVSDAATGEYGYLLDKGMIPLPAAELQDVRIRVHELHLLDL